VHEQKLLDNSDGWHGAELSVIIAGNWQYYRAKVLKYLQQIAVITPYAQVVLQLFAAVCLAHLTAVRIACPDNACLGRFHAGDMCIVACYHTLLQFEFAFQAEDEKNSIRVTFARRTTTMPQPPKACRCAAWQAPARLCLSLVP
jgi:hypothetical protein